MRSSITLYEDQYQFYKELKSKRLLIAFVEYMFEDIEPTGLNKLEKVVRNSLKIRMENQKKKSFAGTQSHGGGRKKNESNQSSDLGSKNNTPNNTINNTKTTKKQEDISISNIIISKDIIVDKKSTTENDNEMLYEVYPYKSKGIDKQVCDKLITKQLNQGSTINGMLKEMKLEGLELRINQGLSYRYGKKLETWLKEYVEGMADNEDRLKRLLVEHRKRLENGPVYKKNPWNEICELFGTEYVNKLFMETKQGIRLFTN